MSSTSAVESLLFAALAKPTAERAACLDSACAGDAELRRQVERLLQAEARAGDFLQKPVVEVLAAAAKPPPDPNVTTDDGPGAASIGGSRRGGDAAEGDLPAVPGYRVLREIARGGMGRVLAALDLSLDRDIALKVLLPGASAERFVRESKITARLPHPGIPPVHALGTLADGSPFLAMKLVAGQTLAAEMKSADRPRLLQAFVQVCQAVGFAHSRSIVHRDLKPANVMVGAFGEVQVMDWGLAKDLTGREVADKPRPAETLREPLVGTDANQTTDHRWPGESTDDRTRAGTVMGTPSYMAPEQAKGEASDARSDVFALGGILCAILTGRPPFSGKSALEIIQRAQAGDLAEADARLGGCGADAELVTLCRRCLSPNPADRPANGQAVADELNAYLNGVQERLQSAQREQAVAVAREAEQRKRQRVQLALAATVLLLLLGGGAVAWWQNEQAGARREVDLRRQIEDERRAATEREFQGRNAEAVAGLLDQPTGSAKEALQAGDAAKAKALLDAADKRAAEGGAEESSARRDPLRADLAVLKDLDEVDKFRWTAVGKKFPDPAVVAARFRAALVRFGLNPEAVPAAEAATRVSDSAVRDRLVTALDWWMREQKLPWVRAVLQAADPHPFRDAVRDAILVNDSAKLADLAARKQAVEQPPGFIAFLGECEAVQLERWRQLLQAAVRQRPGDLGLLITLGHTFAYQEEHADEQLRWYQAAVAVAPRNSVALNSLGSALYGKGQVDEAIACYQKAIDLDPKDPLPHNGLGAALCDGKHDYDGAIASFKKAIDLDPTVAEAYVGLGHALRKMGQLEEAIANYRKAIELDPLDATTLGSLGSALLYGKGEVDEAIACHKKAIALHPTDARFHTNLGATLCDGKHDYDGAIASFKKAIVFDPKYAKAHFGLGNALRAKGQVDESIACYRQALALDPKYAHAHGNLAVALCGKGQFNEAVASFRKALEFDPKLATAQIGLATAQRLAAVQDKLPGLLNGDFKPTTNEERLALAEVCAYTKRYRTALGLYVGAFAADPKLADDLKTAHRYNAACSAVLAAAGQGEDVGKLDGTEKARLRKQALDWLRADLALRGKQLESGQPADSAAVQQALRHWQMDADLAGLRDKDALAKLPADERKAFTQLWADVAALLKKTEEKPK